MQKATVYTRLYGQHKIIPLCKVHTKGSIAVRVFFRKKIQGGGKPMFLEIEGGEGGGRRGHRLELKYTMYFVASASLAYSSCLILHSVCAN